MAYYASSHETIAVGSITSDAVPLNQGILCGFVVSASTISGSLVSFLGSTDGVNYYPVYNSSNAEITLTVSSASKVYVLDSTAFYPFNFIKARLGTSGSSKQQAADPVTVEFVVRNLYGA